MSILKYPSLIILLCWINTLLSAQNFSFGFPSIYNDAVYAHEVLLHESIEDAMTAIPENVIALKISASTENIIEIKKFVNLKFLILDEGFTANSFYLSPHALNSFFIICDQLPELEYIGINDAKLLPYIKNPEKIRGLKISKYDPGVFSTYAPRFKNLQILIIADKTLTTPPNDICNLNSLNQLELYTESLPVLPADIGLLQNLVVARFMVGKIRVLPPSFATLGKLHSLSLKGLVDFKKFPMEICQLKNLEELDIELRNAAEIPDNIGELTRLKSLSLFDCNKVKTLPETLSKLPYLEYIYISGNNKHLDVSSLTHLVGNFSLMLVRCDYVGIARQLQDVALLDEFIVPSGILPSELKKVENYIPPHKIIKRDI